MNLQESESERIVAQVKPGMSPYIAHDLYRLFSGKGCTVAYTDNTVEVSGEYITVEVEIWLLACEHVTHYECQTVNEVMEEGGGNDIMQLFLSDCVFPVAIRYFWGKWL